MVESCIWLDCVDPCVGSSDRQPVDEVSPVCADIKDSATRVRHVPLKKFLVGIQSQSLAVSYVSPSSTAADRRRMSLVGDRAIDGLNQSAPLTDRDIRRPVGVRGCVDAGERLCPAEVADCVVTCSQLSTPLTGCRIRDTSWYRLPDS